MEYFFSGPVYLMFHLHLVPGWAFLSLNREVVFFFLWLYWKCYPYLWLWLWLCHGWFFSFVLIIHDLGLFLVFHRSSMFHSYIFFNLSLTLTEWPNSSTLSSHPDIQSSMWSIVLMRLSTEVLFGLLNFSLPISFQFVLQFFYFFVEFYFHILIWFSYCVQLFVFSWNSSRRLFISAVNSFTCLFVSFLESLNIFIIVLSNSLLRMSSKSLSLEAITMGLLIFGGDISPWPFPFLERLHWDLPSGLRLLRISGTPKLRLFHTLRFFCFTGVG